MSERDESFDAAQASEEDQAWGYIPEYHNQANEDQSEDNAVEDSSYEDYSPGTPTNTAQDEGLALLTEEQMAERIKQLWKTADDDTSATQGNDPAIYGTTDINKPLEIIDCKYLENPFEELHYFYNYVLSTLEDCCSNRAQQRFSKELEDTDWKNPLLIDHRFDNPRKMADKQWHEPGQIELEAWLYFFEKVCLNANHEEQNKVFRYANRVRQAAIHRIPVDVDSLEYALRLPALMGDHKRAAELRAVYDVIIKGLSTAEPATMAEIEKLIHVNKYPIITQNDLLQHIQHRLEVSCHKYCKSIGFDNWNIADWGDVQSWVSPENIELQIYQEMFDKNETAQHTSSLERFPAQDGNRYGFKRALYWMRELRNHVAHRNINVGASRTEGALEKCVERAQTLAVMVGDPEQAVEIRKISDEWIAKRDEAEKLVVKGEESR